MYSLTFIHLLFFTDYPQNAQKTCNSIPWNLNLSSQYYIWSGLHLWAVFLLLLFAQKKIALQNSQWPAGDCHHCIIHITPFSESQQQQQRCSWSLLLRRLGGMPFLKKSINHLSENKTPIAAFRTAQNTQNNTAVVNNQICFKFLLELLGKTFTDRFFLRCVWIHAKGADLALAGHAMGHSPQSRQSLNQKQVGIKPRIIFTKCKCNCHLNTVNVIILHI